MTIFPNKIINYIKIEGSSCHLKQLSSILTQQMAMLLGNQGQLIKNWCKQKPKAFSLLLIIYPPQIFLEILLL